MCLECLTPPSPSPRGLRTPDLWCSGMWRVLSHPPLGLPGFSPDGHISGVRAVNTPANHLHAPRLSRQDPAVHDGVYLEVGLLQGRTSLHQQATHGVLLL